MATSSNDKSDGEIPTDQDQKPRTTDFLSGYVSNDDDASTFCGLEDKGIPTFTLPLRIQKFLEEDETAPYTNDYYYMQALISVERMRIIATNLRDNIAGKIMKVDSRFFVNPTGKLHLRGWKLAEMSFELLNRMQTKLDAKLEGMEHKPVLELLLDRLASTEFERAVFRHIVLVVATSLSYNNIFYNTNNGVSVNLTKLRHLFVQTHAEVSLIAMSKWWDERSPFVKEGFYVRLIDRSEAPSLVAQTRNTQTCPWTVAISKMNLPVWSILLGKQISFAEYNKIGSPALQAVLMEHPVFQESETGKAVQRRKEKEAELTKRSKDAAAQAPSSILKDVLMEQKKKTNKRRPIPGKKTSGRVLDALSVAVQRQEKKLSELKSTTKSSTRKGIEADSDEEEGGTDEYGPYKSDLEYLEDQVRLMRLAREIIKYENMSKSPDEGGGRRRRHMDMYENKMTEEEAKNAKEECKSKKKILSERIHTKIVASKPREFRLEQLCVALELSEFEKLCVLTLVKSIIMPSNDGLGRNQSVQTFVDSFCETLEKKMECRRYFYKSATLIREGILTLSQTDFMTDLTMCRVQLDRRMFDFIVGLDTEFSEIVDGSHLYIPEVNLDDVVLPEETKKRICDAVLNFEKVKDLYEQLDVRQKIAYGVGTVLLFYGHSGTGKTMLANAIATKLKKKVLLVNFPDLGTNSSGAIIKFLFREARINKALLFFDECESLFMTRDKGNTSVNMVLSELEQFDDVCILATNRAYDLDEAMHRRISLSIEFRRPDPLLREKIWEKLRPPKLKLADDVNLRVLAQKFELTGGLIKNAWLQSISLMVQRCESVDEKETADSDYVEVGKGDEAEGKVATKAERAEGDKTDEKEEVGQDRVNEEEEEETTSKHDEAVVCQADLMKAASEQISGQLSMEDFDRRVIPTCGVDAMVLAPNVKDALNSIVHHRKAQAILYGQWGFEKIHRSTTGVSILFTGPSGVGKTFAAEAIGFDLGRPLLVVNIAELVSKWVGETGKNIQSIFADAKKKDAVLVFDEAEGLFGSRDATNSSRHDTMNVNLLLQHIENFSGICVVITNQQGMIDEAFFRRFRFIVHFEKPDVDAREKIWKTTIPAECPLDPNVSLRELAVRYDMSGGNIKNALLRAATAAALRSGGGKRTLAMEDLTKACDSEMGDKKYQTWGMYA